MGADGTMAASDFRGHFHALRRALPMWIVEHQKCKSCGGLHDFSFEKMPVMSTKYDFVCPETNERSQMKPSKAGHRIVDTKPLSSPKPAKKKSRKPSS
jgi:hypothetical protein